MYIYEKKEVRYVHGNREIILDKGYQLVFKKQAYKINRDKYGYLHLGNRLSFAAEAGDLNEVKMLISLGAKRAGGVDPNFKKGEALQISASKGYIEIMQALLRIGAEINQQGQGKFGRSALAMAALNTQIAGMEFLLSKGADANANNADALILSILWNKPASVFYLLKHATFSQNNLNQALLQAAKKDYVDIARELIRHGAHVNLPHIETAKEFKAVQVLQLFRSINQDQKNVIKEKIKLDTITTLSPLNTIRALKAITAPVLSESERDWLERQNVLNCVQKVRDILLHQYPQNRRTSDPDFAEPKDPTLVVFKDLKGNPAFEKKGLLSLTALDNEDTSVTKEAVDNYICQLVDAEITAQSKLMAKAAGKIQFWYKRTRDENKVLAMITNKETSVLANNIMSRR